MNTKRFLIVDDHTIIRRGLRNLLLAQYPGCTVHEAGSWREFELALELSLPDLVLLDLQLGDRHAMDGLGALRDLYPGLRILVFSMSPEHIYAERALAMGCHGYLTKESSEQEVLRAVQDVIHGGVYMSHSTEMRMLDREMDVSARAAISPFDLLSDRELRVMEEVLAGAGVKEIAARMDLGPSTVATYKARLFNKLGVTNLVQLQELVRAHGLPMM
jgi:DNA-binding NarL/FixJ family response regulator